ncbi:hypothetical protein GQX73_g8956 [Xylaria multiplex]|uniref:Protein kinase domain-containing protein n=1 Tax=Xylaria multiplex TaxID=323545 RepID=A0A7C8N216_9PEZI|nr:hypothetical protein GQX73_g8956 [Xylaria multiplex]
MPSSSQWSLERSSQHSSSSNSLSLKSSAQSSQSSSSSTHDPAGLDLFDQLGSKVIKCGPGNHLFSQFSFLPPGALDDVVTKDTVKAQSFWFIFLKNSHFSQILERAKKVFAILVLCGHGELIWDLFKEGLQDGDLPLTESSKYSNILVSPKGKEFMSFSKKKKRAKILVRTFLEKQWLVLAPEFKMQGEHISVKANFPFPFYNIKQVTNYGTNTVYKGVLHSDYIVRIPSDYFSANRCLSHVNTYSKATNPPQDLEIAIKYFPNKVVFEKEKDNLVEIRKLNHPHLIRHIATCHQHVDTRDQDTATRDQDIATQDQTDFFYVIFPWANGGSLANFWEQYPKGFQDSKLPIWCLQQICGLVDALSELHKINCRHGDLKPENILYFKESNEPEGQYGTFVIADVGVSKVHQVETDLRDQNKGTNTKATTPCYEAPEAEGAQTAPRSRRYDMWSIGCILTEFLIWSLYGYKALDSFRDRRRETDGPFPQKVAYYKHTEENLLIVHPDVTDQLEKLKSDHRCAGDTGLTALAELISNNLLVINPRGRIDEKGLKHKVKEILQKAKENSSYLMKGIPDTSEARRPDG